MTVDPNTQSFVFFCDTFKTYKKDCLTIELFGMALELLALGLIYQQETRKAEQMASATSSLHRRWYRMQETDIFMIQIQSSLFIQKKVCSRAKRSCIPFVTWKSVPYNIKKITNKGRCLNTKNWPFPNRQCGRLVPVFPSDSGNGLELFRRDAEVGVLQIIFWSFILLFGRAYLYLVFLYAGIWRSKDSGLPVQACRTLSHELRILQVFVFFSEV